ncbi:MAG TPA: AAA family ATPase [Methylomirabilota bacterium]|nr:AAA family ATPase [Methylomirabilota bacterium]
MGHEVTFDRHRFDPRTGRLWAGRREVALTPRAAAVLAALIARAGQVVTRDELFQSVWGHTVVSDAALTACIQELRGALADDARRPRFIETRHRRGYRFAARVLPPTPQSLSRGTPAPTRPGPPAPVVGRDRELTELGACLERAANGTRQIVFVTGEPGIGKTTLIERFLAEAASGDGLRIAQGRCVETHGAGEAYLPLLEAMTRLCREPGGQPITRLLRHHAPTWLTQMPSVLTASELRTLRRQASGVSRERMLRELAEAVEVIAADVPWVLWLEDLHWSDPPTVEWLGYLARRPGPARVLVLGSCRPVEALARGHPLEATRDELKMHGHCREVALARLDETAVGQYLARRFPADRAFDALAGMIHARTGGNPLFVVNVADDLVRRAVLIERSGRWEVEESAVGQIAIPEDVRRMIGHQLDRVRPDERRILEAASAAGVEFSAAVVAAAEQLGPDDVERACADLAGGASFLTSHGSDTWPDGTVAGHYGFRHALYQEVVYERVPAARRGELHRRIGERLEAGLRERAVEAATELAMHFERGRDPRRAIQYLRVAGEIATQRSAAREAVAHLTRALDLLRGQPDTPERAEQEVALQIAFGGPLMALKGRGAPEVEQAYTRAQELCQRIGDTPQLFPVVWGLFLFRRSRGEIDRAHEFATRLLALARPTNDPGLLIEAHHALWATCFARGELEAAGDHVTQGLALYDADRHASLAAVYGNHDPAVCALGHGAWALELSDEPEQASRRSAEAVALARTLAHPFSEAHALLYAARLHQFRGDWRTTRARAEAAVVLARERGFVQLQAWAAVTGGWALAEAGEIAEGLARMREGIAAIRALGSEDFRTYFLGLLAATLAKAGEPGTALDVLTEALGAVERSGERFYAAELHRQKGELLLATGHDRAGAARCFQTAVEIARRQRARALERRALQSLDDALRRAS